ncbi:hypothetical protein PCE1_001685 [Barthelona sp. PCE]
MDIERVLHMHGLVMALKALKRTGYMNRNVSNCETVASHSVGTGLLALLLPVPANIAHERLIQMAVLHDYVESVTGDLTPSHPQYDSKHHEEIAAAERIFATEPHLSQLIREYEEQSSFEAKHLKKLDKIEMMLTALWYEKEQGVDLSDLFGENTFAPLNDCPFYEDIGTKLLAIHNGEMSIDDMTLTRDWRHIMTLKSMPRLGWGDRETILEHTFGVCFWTTVLRPSNIDVMTAVRFALVHDLAEAFTGDIHPDKKSTSLEAEEDEFMSSIFDGVFSPVWAEYQSPPWISAKNWVFQCDKLDMHLTGHFYNNEEGSSEKYEWIYNSKQQSVYSSESVFSELAFMSDFFINSN